MFKCLTIHLTEPICGCDEENLSWFICYTEQGHGLGLECKTCKTQLRVGHSHFVAGFAFDKKYPGRQAPKPKQTNIVKLSVVPKEDEEVKENEPANNSA